MARKSDIPAYFASPASALPGAPERLPRIPGAILKKSSTPRPEPSPAAAESLPVGGWPRPDDYLDEPDESHRWERIGDKRQEASPATADHGDPHFEIDALVKAHLAKGYIGSTDLKTRVSKNREYASDTCVRREGIDPVTGSRYLEELVFEVVHKRSKSDTKARAEGFAARGVPCQMGIFVKQKEVREWQASAKDWGEPLDLRQSLQAPCLAVPLPLAAIFDPDLADLAIARAQAAKGNPVILKIKDESEKRGLAKGKVEGIAESILMFLQARSWKPSEEQRERILATTDRETLDLWVHRAASASSLDEVLAEE